MAAPGSQMTDCGALALFASFAADTSQTNEQFMADFGALMAKTLLDQLPALGVRYWSAQAVYLNTGKTSGFASMYQNTNPDNPQTGWNGDQGRHFAALFQYGYQNGAALGDITSAVYELLQAAWPFGSNSYVGINMGDVQLGITAAEMGADLKAGKISFWDISGRIMDTLCKH